MALRHLYVLLKQPKAKTKNKAPWTEKVIASMGSVFFGTCFLIWAAFLFTYSVNTDNAILTEFARRMWAGGQFGIDFVDTNPPFSIIAYIPVIWVSSLMSLPLYHAITLYGFLILGISLFFCWEILEKFTFLQNHNKTIFLLSYAAASIAMANINFAERDVLIFSALLPMLLAQFALNRYIALPKKILWPVMMIGTAFILIKPHYGLMPTLMIIWRVIQQRQLKSLWQPDFLSLSIGTSLYILVNALFFRAYWIDFLPNIADTYLRYIVTDTLFHPSFKIALFINALSFFAFGTLKKSDLHAFLAMLSAGALCLLVAYLAQFKGFYYHLLPALIMTFVMIATFVSSLMPPLKSKAYLLPALVVFLLVYAPVKTDYTTHAEYLQRPFGQLLKNCKEPCSFLISTDANYLGFETAMYKNGFFASRYSAFWPQSQLFCDNKGPGDAAFDTFSTAVVDDFRRYKPSVVALIRAHEFCDDGRIEKSDFIAFHSRNKNFIKEWKHYRYAGTLAFNRTEYYGFHAMTHDAKLTFDIYKREEKNP